MKFTLKVKKYKVENVYPWKSHTMLNFCKKLLQRFLRTVIGNPIAVVCLLLNISLFSSTVAADSDFSIAKEIRSVNSTPIAQKTVTDAEIDTLAPGIPSRLKIVEIGSNYVSFAWNKSTDRGNAGMGGYLVYRDGELLQETVNAFYVDDELQPDTAYFYTISAFDLATIPNVSAKRSLKIRTNALSNQAGAVPVEAQSGAVAEPVLVSVESEVDEPEEVMVAELESGAGEAVMPEEEEPAIEPEVVVATEEPAVVITSVEVEEPEIAAASGPDLEAVEGWPTQSNDSLPLGGVFYGTFKGGMMSGNGPIAMENAIRFRAERTGFVKAVRYNNRRLLPTDIGHRCDLYGEGSVWCNCKEAGLDNISCGYTLANSYHVGSGGLITIELRNDDSSSRHLPGKTVLASTNAYVPVEVNNKFPTIALRQPVQVQAGKIYHLVFRNDKPPVGCGLKNLTLAEAAACPRDQGAIGLNGTKHGTDPSPSGRFGPFLGKTGTGLHFKTTANGPWILRKDVIAFYELQYTDGEYIGDTYAGYDNPNYGASKGTQIIEGSTLGRQLFTVEDLTREVNGLWLQYGHVYDRRVNGRPLTVRLKDSAGTVLATGQIPASRECNEIALAAAKDGKARGTRDDWMCRTWAYSDLSTPVSLLEGAEYSVEFSAPAGAGYALSTFFSVHRRDERNMWENARAQISTNNGVNWADWTGSYFASRDLPVLFTIVGMPRRLP